jgi:hypothetical protein
MQMLNVHNPPDDEIDAIIEGLREGSVALPDFRARLG